MKNKILALILLTVMLLAVGCKPDTKNDIPSEKNPDGDYAFKGVVTSLDNDRYIEMEIVDSDIAFGIYWVLLSENTVFVNREGLPSDRDMLELGDKIEVTFSGQVMMSFPPQISAWKITLL